MMKIEICGTSARCIQPMLLTAGLVGAQAEFTFDAAWDGLSRIAVFTDGLVTKDAVLGADNRCEIPHEVLTEAGRVLCVGVYGAAGDGTVVIPTVSAACGMVRTGAEPTGDESYPPTPDVAAQLLQRIEAVESSGGGGSGGSGAVQSVNGKTGRVELTAEDVGTLPLPEGAVAGRFLKITAVNEAGKVTETETADLECGETWRIIKKIRLTQDVQSIVMDTDDDGKPFSLKKFIIWGWTQGTASGGQLRINAAVRTDSANSYFGSWIANFRGLDTTKRYWRFECSRGPVVGDHAKWYAEYAAPDSGTTMQALGATNWYHTPEDDNGNNILAATFINILSNTSTVQFTAGSEIELWGVDA